MIGLFVVYRFWGIFIVKFRVVLVEICRLVFVLLFELKVVLFGVKMLILFRLVC